MFAGEVCEVEGGFRGDAEGGAQGDAEQVCGACRPFLPRQHPALAGRFHKTLPLLACTSRAERPCGGMCASDRGRATSSATGEFAEAGITMESRGRSSWCCKDSGAGVVFGQRPGRRRLSYQGQPRRHIGGGRRPQQHPVGQPAALLWPGREGSLGLARRGTLASPIVGYRGATPGGRHKLLVG